jgi:hypothetical protein
MKEKLETYRKNAVMTGVLFILGTVFGVLSAVVGGDVISSSVQTNPLSGPDLLSILSADPSKLVGGSFLILLMGISLTAMTVFLYPIFRKDSKELAAGMLLFRGALEGTYYFATMLGFVALFALGKEYVATGANSAALQSMIKVVYQLLDILGPAGTILFLIGTTCLYISFYRTRLIPRWLSVWGMIGVVPYMAYALLHFFRMDTGYGFYLQMVLAPQEMVMAVWLIVKGFNPSSIASLTAQKESNNA